MGQGTSIPATYDSITLPELELLFRDCRTPTECMQQLKAASAEGQLWVQHVSGEPVDSFWLALRWAPNDPHLKVIKFVHTEIPRWRMRIAAEAKVLEGFVAEARPHSAFHIYDVGRVQHATGQALLGHDPCLRDGRTMLLFGLFLLRVFRGTHVTLQDAAEVVCKGMTEKATFPLSLVRKLAGKPGFYEAVGFQFIRKDIEPQIAKLVRMTPEQLLQRYPTKHFWRTFPPELMQETLGKLAHRFIYDATFQQLFCNPFRAMLDKIVNPRVGWWKSWNMRADLAQIRDIPDSMELYCAAKRQPEPRAVLGKRTGTPEEFGTQQ